MMHANKKIIVVLIVALFPFIFLSGCTLQNLFGSSITINSWSVCDDDGFPAVDLYFSNTGRIFLKTLDSTGEIFDSEEFFFGDHNVKLNIGSYQTNPDENIFLKGFDIDGNEFFEKKISFNGYDLSIDSCDQKWWKRQSWKGGYSLIGVILSVSNNGDIPAYPYYVDVEIDDNTVSGYALPCVILPGETKNVKSFIYHADSPSEEKIDVTIKDLDKNILTSNIFDIKLEDNVEVKKFYWRYDGRRLSLSVPYPDFLHEYYQNLDRIILEDYSFYVFDKYDEDYLVFFADQLQYSSSSQSASDKINFAAAFIQNLEYRHDVGEFDYPNYPLETLFSTDGGCDCEDMSILTANILDRMGYDVALFRLTNHMAVGVKVDGEIEGYDTYEDDYYFLETTSKNHKIGYIPNSYQSKPGLVVYPISNRPLLGHTWYDGNITIYYDTDIGDVVKAVSIVYNLGRDTASNIKYEGVFYTSNGLEFRESAIIDSIKPGMQEKIYLMVEFPDNLETKFKTRIYDDNNQIVDYVKSDATFP